ncbi:hypothetical protein BCR32DRAFT_251397 [Anaeromyces robustus]|uniref:Uncharacterized protein n=1 Tax=Anaeromyces robustus TaxID=1754192 RepID=A0A1Y1VS26_9FUNG|nr:hypothetical protein BCR32DRAFT_251397 [Anaeromyces robustus]|eukprot:ORX63845.1 hypothetical protein BCR32DRAFT_251397 [Anaeromyces robustus]
MTSILTALRISKYITEKQDFKNLDEAEKQKDAIAKSILLNNIEDKIYPTICQTDSAYDLMENLRNLYKEDQDVTLQEWMNKLKQLKVKNNHDLLNVISKMMSIFKQMDNADVPLTESEKTNNMLGCMLNQLKIIFISGNTKKADELFEDIKLKFKLLYHVGNNNNYEYKNNREPVDRMDIDLMENILNINNNKNRNKTFCHICKMNNHNTIHFNTFYTYFTYSNIII